MNYPICALDPLDSTQRFVLCKMWHEENFYKILPKCSTSTTFTVFYNLNCFHDKKGNAVSKKNSKKLFIYEI